MLILLEKHTLLPCSKYFCTFKTVSSLTSNSLAKYPYHYDAKELIVSDSAVKVKVRGKVKLQYRATYSLFIAPHIVVKQC